MCLNITFEATVDTGNYYRLDRYHSPKGLLDEEEHLDRLVS